MSQQQTADDDREDEAVTAATPRPVAIVTGAGTGMGRACALELAADHQVVMVGRRLEVLEQAAAEANGSVMVHAADLSMLDDVQRLVGAVMSRFGRIDVLVNSAGAAQWQPILTGMELSDIAEIWAAMLAQNATTTFLTCYAVAPHLTRPGGRIVNFSSEGAVKGGPRPGGAGYLASKGAVQGLSIALAQELSAQGITVNVVSPGYIADTEMSSALPQDRKEQLVAATAVKRGGVSDEVAALVRYLVSPRSGFVTGQIMHINGGSVFGR